MPKKVALASSQYNHLKGRKSVAVTVAAVGLEVRLYFEYIED
jgi:hypothetical protein